MADELKIGASLVFDDGDSYVVFGKSGLLIDVAGTNYLHHRQSVGDSEEALVVGDVVVGGYFIGYNGHATAVISMRPGTGENDLIDIGPGEIAMFRINTGLTPYVISTVAAAELEYVIIDN